MMRMCFSYNGTYDNLFTGQHRKKSSTIKILTLPDLVFPMTSYGELLQDCDAARSEEVLVGGRVDEPRVGVAVHERVDLQLRLVERVLREGGMERGAFGGVAGNRFYSSRVLKCEQTNHSGGMFVGLAKVQKTL